MICQLGAVTQAILIKDLIHIQERVNKDDFVLKLLAEPDALQHLPISKQWLDGLKFSDCLPERFASRAARGRIRVDDEVLSKIQI